MPSALPQRRSDPGSAPGPARRIPGRRRPRAVPPLARNWPDVSGGSGGAGRAAASVAGRCAGRAGPDGRRQRQICSPLVYGFVIP
ncbi:unnamed protein product [Lepidochelys olivacea]